MAKAVVLKSIVWNDNRYKTPSGYYKNPSRSGTKKSFPAKYGYGHEEWNNNENREWRGWKIFHTEATERLFEYSKHGELGLIMIASNGGVQYAVGIACDVYHNSKPERNIITEDLGIYDSWKDVWSLDTVKKCFNHDKKLFINHWGEHEGIKWKCSPKYYYWFPEPIKLDPKNISGKIKLTCMYGRFQWIRREDVLKIIDKYLPKKHKIREWLTTGEFDPDILPKGLRKKPQKSSSSLQKKYSSGRANKPPEKGYEYWVEGKREVEPLHAFLQAKFIEFLKKNKNVEEIRENYNYIDVQYRKNKHNVFCEIKPTKNIETKYAIRIAVGQLLDYQYRYDKNALLEIVLSSEPTLEEKNFIKYLKMILTYYDEANDTFITITP